jgi:hypothetical protein
VAHRNRARNGGSGRAVGNTSECVGPRVAGVDEEVGERRGARAKLLADSVGPDRGRRRPAPVATRGEEECSA